jgi:DNA-binding Lrp family transcriptional regulator
MNESDFRKVGLTMDALKLKILELLKEDARRSADLIATMLGTAEDEVARAISEMEADKVIVKYATVVNWSKVDDEKVTALIEVQITPERGRGFDAIAERIYLYPEVKSVYLMSGAYDLLVEIEGSSLKQVASFVSNKLSPIDRVLSTKTNFILKKYKQDGIIFEDQADDHRMLVSP